MGPATSSPEKIRELVDAGMDVARLNMSHGTRDEHAEVYRLIRAASDATGHGVGIFADLQGPKIRLGNFERRQARRSSRATGSRSPPATSWATPPSAARRTTGCPAT